jgi:PEGA domain
MRIVGFLLAFLCLSPATVIHYVEAQAVSQPIDSSPSQIGSATSEPQVAVQKPSSPKNADDGSSVPARKLHLRMGTVLVGAGYSHFSGPAYYPYGPSVYPGGWEYSALWFPYWGPYSFFAPGYFTYGSAKGEVKLAADPKTAEVYLDRAYAGTADHLRSMWLEPGAYDLSLTASGDEVFHQRIYVLSGKSLKITAKLASAKQEGDEAKDKR